jgi:hypothetical protein
MTGGTEMKKWLSLLPVSLIAIGLQAQAAPAQAQAQAAGMASTRAGAQAGHTAARAVQVTELQARLTKEINSKHARVGDQVLARTTSTAKLSNGMKLPRNTELIGKVTEVQAKSRAHHNSRLAFTFERAVLKHGRTIPIHAVITSVSVPSALAAADGASSMNAGAADAGGMAGGGAMAGPAPVGGGGLVGGAVHGVGGVAGGAGSMVNQTGSMANGALGATSRLGANAGSLAGSGAAQGMAGVSGAPVAGLPGVMFSSAASSNNSAAMSARGENISLLSGTQMNMNVIESGGHASASGSAGGYASMQ